MKQEAIKLEALKEGFKNGTFNAGFTVFAKGEQVKVTFKAVEFIECSGERASDGTKYSFPALKIDSCNYTESETNGVKAGSVAPLSFISVDEALVNFITEAKKSELELYCMEYTNKQGDVRTTLKPILK